MNSQRLLRFADLKQRNIVNNHPQLKRLVAKNGFPPGRWLGDNTRFWTEDEIENYLASRPAAGQPNEAA